MAKSTKSIKSEPFHLSSLVDELNMHRVQLTERFTLATPDGKPYKCGGKRYRDGYISGWQRDGQIAIDNVNDDETDIWVSLKSLDELVARG